MNETYIKNILKKTGIEDTSNLTIGRLKAGKKFTWLIVTPSSAYVLKAKYSENKSLSPVRLMKKFINFDSESVFFRELSVYRELNKLKFKSFKYPKTICIEPDNYILMEYLDTAKGGHKVFISPKLLADSLFEFNSSVSKFRFDKGTYAANLKKITGRFGLRKSSFLVVYCFLYCLLFKIPNPKPLDFYKCIITLLKCALKQKKNKQSFIMHQDLIEQSNILISNNSIYFYDFEAVFIENRWILKDAIDLSFTFDLEFNTDVLKEYLSLLNESDYVNVRVDVKSQVRAALLHRLIKKIYYKVELPEDGKQKVIAFIRNILLSDVMYDSWYDENIGL